MKETEAEMGAGRSGSIGMEVVNGEGSEDAGVPATVSQPLEEVESKSTRKRRRGPAAVETALAPSSSPRTPRPQRRTVSMSTSGASSSGTSTSSASPSMPPPLPIKHQPRIPEPLASTSTAAIASPSTPLELQGTPSTRRGRFLSLSPSPAFDLIVVGCGGGPCEDNLSAYFLKSSIQKWEDGFVGLDAGSGLGAVRKLLEEEEVDHPGAQPPTADPMSARRKGKGRRKGGPFYDFEAVRIRNQALAAMPTSARPLNPSIPFTPTVPSMLGPASSRPASALASTFLAQAEEPPTSELDPSHLSGHIYAPLKGFLLSHAHFDHMASLVLSAGALTKCPKEVWGIESTCANVMSVFDGGVWPKLAARESRRGWPLWVRPLSLADEVDASDPVEVDVCPSLKARAFRVAHGVLPSSTPHPSPVKANSAATEASTSTTECCGGGEPPQTEDRPKASASASTSTSLIPGMPSPEPYESTAFFVTDAATGKDLLFFGDVGPDSVSGLCWNRRVWEEAALRLGKGTLAAIFIECSYPSSRKEEQLYGHLSPPFLFEELCVLASLCETSSGASESSRAAGKLEGLPIVIMHVKDDTWPLPVSVAPPTPHPLGPGKVPVHDSMRDWIGHEIDELEKTHKLGCRIVMARQGDRFRF